MTGDPYSPPGLSVRCGALTFAVEILLEVIADCPVVLDPFHQVTVDAARKALDEYGLPAVTR